MARIADQDVFLKRLAELGGSCSNSALREKLGWADEKYWRVRDELLDLGRVAKGRGYGGTVRLVEDAASTHDARPPSEPPPPSVTQWTDEASLYEPFASVLQADWAKEQRIDSLVVEVTARQGRRSTGGTWTRPDITVVTRRGFRYVPTSQFDVWTFELKPSDAIDVVGVFEAAAHVRRATRAFVAFHVPVVEPEREDVLKRCEAEAERIGVGLIAFVDPRKFNTWDIRVPARRHETPEDLLDEFIAEQLSDAAKERIRTWGR